MISVVSVIEFQNENDYASVMGPDIDSSMLMPTAVEAPTLKLSHRALPDCLDLGQRVDGCQVSYLPHYLVSLILAETFS